MRANVPDFELVSKGSVDEVCALLNAEPGVWRPFAGGTDLMVQFESGKLQHKKFVNLAGFSELSAIIESPDNLRIGALCTYTDIQNHSVVKTHFPLLIAAAQLTGAIAIQNRGTLGGNIANASPAADSLPALLVYEAEIELRSIHGIRTVPYNQFHQAYKKFNLQPNEIISAIKLPRSQSGFKSYFRKVGTRNAQAITKVSLAALKKIENNRVEDVRMAMASVAEKPQRLFHTEDYLRHKEIKNPLSEIHIKEIYRSLAKDISPQSDIRSTQIYRMKVAQNLVQEFLEN